jgi:hypothetical protein
MSCSLPGVTNPNYRHGHKTNGTTRTYRSWQAMLTRTRNPHSKWYPAYGGKGISVCERWLTFDNFLSDMGNCPTGLTLDRIQSKGNYEPGNCRWATRTMQNQNRPSNTLCWEMIIEIRKQYIQQGVPIFKLAKKYGVPYATMSKAARGKTWRNCLNGNL